jgi:hypothetical protein
MKVRDSLLGRQGVTNLPLARYRSPVEADQTGIPLIDAALTKGVAHSWQKISRTFPGFVFSLGHKISRTSLGRRLRSQRALEQLYQNFCANTREAGGLPRGQGFPERLRACTTKGKLGGEAT